MLDHERRERGIGVGVHLAHHVDGGAVQTKPAYMAEPPTAGPFSTRTTLAPSAAALAAALIPAIPPPTTRRSPRRALMPSARGLRAPPCRPRLSRADLRSRADPPAPCGTNRGA